MARDKPDQMLQHVWVSCAGQEEQDDIFMLCKKGRQALLRPRTVKPDAEQCDRWHGLMLIQWVPKPYHSRLDPGYRADIDAWLTASYEESLLHQQDETDACRHYPSILVTDSLSLIKASADPDLRRAVARALSLEIDQLLPVVMWSDFGRLSGLVLVEDPVAVSEPQLEYSARMTPSASTLENSEEVIVADGVYVQRAGADVDQGQWPEAYGARCLALFSEGRCAYCAVSPDGAKAIESAGTWEVINGQIVVIGTASYMRLSFGDKEFVLDNEIYDEPVHISLEQLKTEFDPPKKVGDFMSEVTDLDAEYSQTLSSTSVVDLHNSAMQQDDDRPSARLSRRTPDMSPPPVPWKEEPVPVSTWKQRTLPEARMFDTSQALPSAGPASMSSPVPKNATKITGVSMLSSTSSMRRSLPATGRSLAKLSKSSTVRQSHLLEAEEAYRPRMLGGLRNIKFSRCSNLDPGMAGPMAEHVKQPVARLLADYASKVNAISEPLAYPKCPLQPGFYVWEQGQAGALDHVQVKVILHAGGACSYRETSPLKVINTYSSMVRSTAWYVQENFLILDTCEAGSHCYWQREAHGTRFKQHKLTSLKLPLQFMLKECTYTCFDQISNPFPGHVEVDAAEKAAGLLDPSSPVLDGVNIRQDTISFSTFVYELQRDGLQLDDLLSDFRFIDRNEDGHINIDEFKLLDQAGKASLPTETFEELRTALLVRFGDLDRGFEEMAAMNDVTHVPLAQFKEFLQSAATLETKLPEKKKLGDGTLLESWLAKISESDQEEVFYDLNGRRHATLDLRDFRSLSLHAGLLGILRLEHFQGWVFAELGRTEEAFEKIFEPSDETRPQTGKKPSSSKAKKKQKKGTEIEALELEAFKERLKELNFQCQDVVANSIFRLMDRNFDRKLAKEEMTTFLLKFSSQSVISSFVALKGFIEKQFGGISECFEKMIEVESAATKWKASSVSYGTCENMLAEAGVLEALPDIDLRMLFLFLDAATEKPPDGFLNLNEWALLHGFDTEFIEGSPERLCKLLNDTYGSLEDAFKHIHKSWLVRSLAKSMRNVAFHSMARAFACGATGPVPIGSVPIQPAHPKAKSDKIVAPRRPGFKGHLINPQKMDLDRSINPHSRYYVSSACGPFT